MRFSHAQAHDPATVIALSWSEMNAAARILVWVANPNLAKASRHLAKYGTPYINAQILDVPARREQPRQAPVTDAVNRMMASSGRR